MTIALAAVLISLVVIYRHRLTAWVDWVALTIRGRR